MKKKLGSDFSIANVSLENNRFFFDFPYYPEQDDLFDNPWIVINETDFNDERGYRLNEGDYIKIGKLLLEVKGICLKPLSDQRERIDYKTEIEVDQTNMQLKRRMSDEPMANLSRLNKSNELMCRICLSSEVSDSDPLINPCNCIGSMKYIHINCLKQ